MLTFVAAFDESIGLNLFDTLHITDTVTSTTSFDPAKQDTNMIDAIVNGVMAVIFLFIATVTVAIITLVLLFRIVAIWILLVLAPLPYILYAFPKTKAYAGEWWNNFINYVIVGPSLAFFLWLAFAVVGQGDFIDNESLTNAWLKPDPDAPSVRNAFLAILKPDIFVDYIIGIAMLIGGLVVTQKLGVAGGGMAGKAVSGFKGAGVGAVRWAGRRADDAQAGLVRRTGLIGGIGKLSESKFGKSRAGRMLGLQRIDKGAMDTLQREGARFRTLPGAWKSRSARVESERVGRSQEAAEDVLNRALLTRKETDNTRRKRAADEKAAQKLVEETSNDADEVKNNLVSQDLSETGKVKRGSEADAVGKLRALVKDHNANELVFGAKKIFGDDLEAFNESLKNKGRHLDFDSSKEGLEYTANNMQEIVRHMFADESEEEQARIMFDLGEVGFANKDGMIKNMAIQDDKGSFQMLTADRNDKGERLGATELAMSPKQKEKAGVRTGLDEQREIALKYMKKLEGRPYTQRYVSQNMFTEQNVEDKNGESHRISFGLNKFGLEDLHTNPGALTAEWHLASNEVKGRFMENSDILYEKMREYEESKEEGSDDKANDIGRLLHEVVGFNLRGRGGHATDLEVHNAAQVARDEKRKLYDGKVNVDFKDLGYHETEIDVKRKESDSKDDKEEYERIKKGLPPKVSDDENDKDDDEGGSGAADSSSKEPDSSGGGEYRREDEGVLSGQSSGGGGLKPGNSSSREPLKNSENINAQADALREAVTGGNGPVVTELKNLQNALQTRAETLKSLPSDQVDQGQVAKLESLIEELGRRSSNAGFAELNQQALDNILSRVKEANK